MGSLKTSLYDKHILHGGNLVSFGGYLLPMHYGSIKFEHELVRSKAGLFDVSHMGQFIILGSDAEEFLQIITVNDVKELTVGQVQYTVMCYDDGGIIDDLLLYKKSSDEFMMIVNASNIKKDYEWLEKNLYGDIKLNNISASTSILAIQGPRSRDILQKISDIDLTKIGFYKFMNGSLNGFDSIISRTGYTGELGFELYIDSNVAIDVWDKILDAGDVHGIQPVGLGCRDTLRMEMKYLLYGNDIDQNTNPIEAGLGWITKFKKNTFIGKNSIKKLKNNNKRRLVCILMDDRGIPRNGYRIYKNNDLVGLITSGTMSPSLSKGIGIGYVDLPYTNPDTILHIDIRGKRKKAVIIKPPFYKNGSLMG